MRTGEPELELIQTHMAQKPVLRVEVGARALRVRSVSREEAWASAGVQDAWVHDVHLGHLQVLARSGPLRGIPNIPRHSKRLLLEAVGSFRHRASKATATVGSAGFVF